MAERSPNFPQISLVEAIDSIRLIYQREGRSKMPKLSAVKPLGYTSINGRSLGVLAALRAYGLLDGRGDDVRVSDDALTILNAPKGTDERSEAIKRAFEAPPAFALLRSKDGASADTLRWHLIKANFRDDAADKLIKVFLESRDLVNAEVGEYDAASPVDDAPSAPKAMPRVGDVVRWESQGVIQFEDRRVIGVSDDGDWAFVEGSQTGIPMSELEILERTAAPPSKAPPQAPANLMRAPTVATGAMPDFVVKLGDGRIALIEIKGGEAEPRHLAKLERFIKLQKQLLLDDDFSDPETDGIPIESDLKGA